jgi:hypothetical protein
MVAELSGMRLPVIRESLLFPGENSLDQVDLLPLQLAYFIPTHRRI